MSFESTIHINTYLPRYRDTYYLPERVLVSIQSWSELIRGYYRTEFQKYLSVSKKDFTAIEFLLRKGQKQLEMYSSPGIRNIQ